MGAPEHKRSKRPLQGTRTSGENRALSERLRNHASQMRQGQNSTGREAALSAVEDEQVRAQEGEATHYKGSSPKARTSHSRNRRNRRDDETPGEH